jgi:diguanylate cyclase (GGDEF)-like protein/PAS domain S-box-containing protein
MTESRGKTTNHKVPSKGDRQGGECLMEDEKWLRLLLCSVKQGIYAFDRDGKCIFCNPAAVRMLGYWDDSEVIGKNVHALISQKSVNGDPYPWGAHELVQIFREGKSSHVDDKLLWRTDGTSFPVEYWSSPIRRDGKIVGVVVTFVDITERKRAQERFRLIVESAPNAIVMVNPAGIIVLVNSQTEKIFGYERDELIGQPLEVLVPEHLRNRHLEYRKGFLADHQTRMMGTGRDLVGRRKDGSEVFLEIGLNRIETDEGTLILSAIVDITERKRMEYALFEVNERAQVTLHSIGDAVITTDPDGAIEYMNPVAEMLTGWSADEASGQLLSTVFEIYDEQSHERVLNLVAKCHKENRVIRLTERSVLISRGGQEYAIQDSLAPIWGRQDELLGMVLVFHDVTDSRRMAREISHQANHDSLTGLLNRREFERRLEHALVSARTQGIQHALCYLDLDQFKLVNDTAGHVVGDQLLRQVADLLRTKLRTRDTLARVGGDEFSLLLENCPLDKALQIAKTLVAAVRDFRFTWDGRSFDIGVSIGLVSITAEVNNTVQLLSQADVACYAAKDRGRNRVHLYQIEDNQPGGHHTEIFRATELRDALENDRFRLYYQPIVPLFPSNDDSSHYEILLRLLDAKDNIVLPATFIPAAERFGIMAAIDRWVIRTVCRYAAEVVGSSLGTGIAINLSGNSLKDDSLLDFVHQQLFDTTLPPERFCFEITETAAIGNLKQATGLITELKKSGCRFALDDFGSGLSSFTYLKYLPVDYVKIDGSFVRDMVVEPIDHAMVAAINQVGHTMGIQTIAEYAESEAIVAQLKALNVDYAQGYAIGSPRPLEEMGYPPIS